MWYMMEQLANQREREIAARTRAPLFATEPRPGRTVARPVRTKRTRGTLPALSFGKWRHWAARPEQVHCSRAAALAGDC
jgi:hypothetical protein